MADFKGSNFAHLEGRIKEKKIQIFFIILQRFEIKFIF